MSEEDAFTQSKDTFYLIFIIPAIFVIIILTLFLFSGIATKDFDVRELEHSFLMQRLLYSPTCLALHEGERVQPGTLDLSKFTPERIAKCISIRENEIGMKATLRFRGETREIFLNPLFEPRNFLCDLGNAFCSSNSYYVLVADGNQYFGGYLDLTVIQLKPR